MENEILTITAEEAGIRLDKVLIARFPSFSRTYFQQLIEKELVLVNGIVVKKRTPLAEGDEIEIEFTFPKEITLTPEKIPLDILYEDEAFLAINKPPGMVVHPGAGNWTGTFVNALLYHCQTLPHTDTLRPGIVHRLDKETSGVLLAAKTEEVQRKLVLLFSERKITKHYLAICIGNPGTRTIEGPIGRHPRRRQEMTILDRGKEALTRCQSLAFNNHLSLVSLHPHTGRTHQLRVHLKSIGTPILGDAVYGNRSLNQKWNVTRQLLHAESLTFSHPLTGAPLELKAPIPDDMQKFINTIKR